MMFCVPAERIVGRKMIRIEKRSVGTHGVTFPKWWFNRFARSRYNLDKTFIIIEATYDMSLWDIEERSLNFQMMFVLQQGRCLP